MKKAFLAMMATAISFVSCNDSEDNNDIIQDKELFNVKLNVSAFEVEVKPMSRIGQPVDDTTIKSCFYLCL